MDSNLLSSSRIVLKNQQINKPVQISRKRKRNQAPIDVSVKKYRCVGITLLVEDYTFPETIPDHDNMQYVDVRTVSKVELQIRVPVIAEDEYLGKSNNLFLRRDILHVHQHNKLRPLEERFRWKSEEITDGTVSRDLQRTDALRRQFERSVYFDENYPLKFNQRITQSGKKTSRLIRVALFKIKIFRDERLACENEILRLEERFRTIYTSGDNQKGEIKNLKLSFIKNPMNCPRAERQACKNVIIMDVENVRSICKSPDCKKETKKITNFSSIKKPMNASREERPSCSVWDIEKRCFFTNNDSRKRGQKHLEFPTVTKEFNSSIDEIQVCRSLMVKDTDKQGYSKNGDFPSKLKQINSCGEERPSCVGNMVVIGDIRRKENNDNELPTTTRQINCLEEELQDCKSEMIKDRSSFRKGSDIWNNDKELESSIKQINFSGEERQDSKNVIFKDIEKRCFSKNREILRKEKNYEEFPSTTKQINFSRKEKQTFEKIMIKKKAISRQTLFTSDSIVKEEIIDLELPSSTNQIYSREELQVRESVTIKDTEKHGPLFKSKDTRRKDPRELELSTNKRQINSSSEKLQDCKNEVVKITDMRRLTRRKDSKDHKFPTITKQMNFSREFYEKVRITKRAISRQSLFPSDDIQSPQTTDSELPTITSEMEERYNDIIKGDIFEVVVSKFNLNIKRSSIRTLMELRWLDDEVINFYVNLIAERSVINANELPSVYCMNTFFVTRLYLSGYGAVKRWTRDIDLFSKDIIVVPIHINKNHWIMVIIHMKNKTILCYDSMGHSNQRVLLSLENYLQEESLDKRKVAFDTSEFLIKKAPKAPRQTNSCDCGVFSCMVAEYITRNQMPTFTQEDMPYFRKKMALEICDSKLWL